MEQNPLTDITDQVKQYQIEKSLHEFTEELRKVNIKLSEIEELLKNSDKTYIK